MKLYNTMTRSVDELKPLVDGKIKFYTCGLTVYSQPQIGNWTAFIYSDVLTRTLLASGYDVQRVQNITDVGHLVSDDDDGEDKMEKGARQEGTTAWDIAAKYIAIADDEAYNQLGLLRPDQLVRATDLISEQINFAQILDDKGYLYRTDDGMYFDTAKIENYGKLARLDVAGLEAGARVDVGGKRNPTDFAVWKFSPNPPAGGQTRDMEWDSPWGTGFPGWHLECSTIARQNLGDQIDLHSGGIDHIPVHHSNEIAQTEAVTDTQFVGSWFHNNHLKVDGAKLSKSLGNSYTLADITDRGYDLDAFKLLVLSSQYRTEGNFSWDIIDAAQNRLAKWRAYATLRWQTHDTLTDDDAKSNGEQSVSLLAAKHAVLEALQTDLDTPKALAIIDETFARLDHKSLERIHQASLAEFIVTIDDLLGLRLALATPDIAEDAKRLIIERQRARDENNWQRSDELRDELLTFGVHVRDTPSGTIWSW